MKSYPAAQLDAQNTYKVLSGSVLPRPIAWISTKSEKGIVNVAPFSFFNVASSKPPLLSVAFTGNKDSLNNILSTKEAVVHLVNMDNVNLMNHTAAPLAASVSEAETFGIELENSEMVSVPSLKKSKVRFETKLYYHLPLGEQGHLVLLEIVNFVFDDEVLNEQNFHIDVDKLNSVARLAGNHYAQLGEIFEIIRPK